MKLFSIAILFLLLSCNSHRETAQNRPDSLAKSHVLGSDLTPVKLMGDTLTGIGEKTPLIVRDRSVSDSVRIFPYSFLFGSNQFNTFIVSFNDYSPTIITLDKKQLVIDSMGLIGNLPKETNDSRHTKQASISNASDIVITDSTFTWTLDQNQSRIKKSEKVDVTITKYRIDDQGKIVRTN